MLGKYLTNFLTISTLLFLLGCSLSIPEITSSQILPISAQTQIGNKLIKLEVAKTTKEQATGLMNRTFLANDRGMLFEFKPAQKLNFWMKNCKIPLDMIFVRNEIVTTITANAPPCVTNPCPNYAPNTTVDRVIELQGGQSAKLGIRIGDRIKIEFLHNSQQ
ncbi:MULTISPECIES: DUF192 domain-containing protein [unclassified Microcoleus]|uniref:DUF192 domain-containing protein n=1 Tax=unclassified Microcoleus TaxID=2642155 RepID=UPI002FD67A5D